MKRAASGASRAARDTAVDHSEYSLVAANPQGVPTPRALNKFIGDGLRALRHAAALACDDVAPAQTAQVLYGARDAVNSAIWAVEYTVTFARNG